MVLLQSGPTRNAGTGNYQDDKALSGGLGLRNGVRVDSTASDGQEASPIWVYRQDAANNIKSFQDRGFRADSNLQGVFASDALNHKIAQIIEQRFSPLTASLMFQVNAEGGWNETIEHFYEEVFGIAAKICCGADFDRTSITGRSIKVPIITVGSGYELCYEEQMKAREAQIDVVARLDAGATRSIETYLNNLCFFGDTASGIMGIANNPLLGWAGAGFDLSDPNVAPEVILAALQRMANSRYVASGMAHPKPDTMALAPSLMTHLSTRLMGQFDGATILKRLKETTTIQTLIEVPEFEFLGPQEQRMSLFYKRDRNAVEWHVPGNIQTLPPHDNGYGYSINKVARVSSLWFNHPGETVRMLG